MYVKSLKRLLLLGMGTLSEWRMNVECKQNEWCLNAERNLGEGFVNKERTQNVNGAQMQAHSEW